MPSRYGRRPPSRTAPLITTNLPDSNGDRYTYIAGKMQRSAMSSAPSGEAEPIGPHLKSLKQAQGEPIDVEVTCSLARWNHREARLAIVRDVRRRLRTERMLRVATNAMANTSEGVVITDGRFRSLLVAGKSRSESLYAFYTVLSPQGAMVYASTSLGLSGPKDIAKQQLVVARRVVEEGGERKQFLPEAEVVEPSAPPGAGPPSAPAIGWRSRPTPTWSARSNSRAACSPRMPERSTSRTRPPCATRRPSSRAAG